MVNLATSPAVLCQKQQQVYHRMLIIGKTVKYRLYP